MVLGHTTRSRAIEATPNVPLGLLLASGVLRSTTKTHYMTIIKQFFTVWGPTNPSRGLDHHKEKHTCNSEHYQS